MANIYAAPLMSHAHVDGQLAVVNLILEILEAAKNPDVLLAARKTLLETQSISAEKISEANRAEEFIKQAAKDKLELAETKQKHDLHIATATALLVQKQEEVNAGLDQIQKNAVSRNEEHARNTKALEELRREVEENKLVLVAKEKDIFSKETLQMMATEELTYKANQLSTREKAVADKESALALKKQKLLELTQEG